MHQNRCDFAPSNLFTKALLEKMHFSNVEKLGVYSVVQMTENVNVIESYLNIGVVSHLFFWQSNRKLSFRAAIFYSWRIY